MKVLVLNCGSSSVKYQLIETSPERIEANDDATLARGAVERIGTGGAIHTLMPTGGERIRRVSEILEHKVAIADIIRLLTDPDAQVVSGPGDIEAVGHRVVHGGERFARSALITPEVAQGIEECSELAPLHNPHNLSGWKAARAILPDVPHAAVFDTAFHQTMPPHAHLYGVPYVLYTRHHARRYGFHGTSHRYLVWRSQALLGRRREDTKLVTCHLGNGASVCAVDHGRSIDTTMGFTPLEGLMMGTRSGDVDPSLVFHVMHKEDLTEHQAMTMLNRHSGLYGVSGISNDMAELLDQEAKGHERARLAIDMFCYRVRKAIGAYLAALGGADAVIFSGGIGENAPTVRARCVTGLAPFGVALDAARNGEAVKGREGDVSAADTPVRALVIPTNEELVIARDTLRLVLGILPP